MAKRSLSDQWLIDKLEEIAQDDSSRSAQIRAILRLLSDSSAAEAPDGVAALYEVGNPANLRTKKG
jgi:hypothetical protein